MHVSDIRLWWIWVGARRQANENQINAVISKLYSLDSPIGKFYIVRRNVLKCIDATVLGQCQWAVF